MRRALLRGIAEERRDCLHREESEARVLLVAGPVLEDFSVPQQDRVVSVDEHLQFARTPRLTDGRALSPEERHVG